MWRWCKTTVYPIWAFLFLYVCFESYARAKSCIHRDAVKYCACLLRVQNIDEWGVVWCGVVYVYSQYICSYILTSSTALHVTEQSYMIVMPSIIVDVIAAGFFVFAHHLCIFVHCGVLQLIDTFCPCWTYIRHFSVRSPWLKTIVQWYSNTLFSVISIFLPFVACGLGSSHSADYRYDCACVYDIVYSALLLL